MQKGLALGMECQTGHLDKALVGLGLLQSAVLLVPACRVGRCNASKGKCKGASRRALKLVAAQSDGLILS